MVIVHVFIHVKEESIDDFRSACTENARNSVLEPGVARFDVIEQSDDPSRFVLVEVYRTEQASSDHKSTAHYRKWKTMVESMMAEPRYSIKFTNVFHGENGWG